jgi:predicted secreted hydrolase
LHVWPWRHVSWPVYRRGPRISAKPYRATTTSFRATISSIPDSAPNGGTTRATCTRATATGTASSWSFSDRRRTGRPTGTLQPIITRQPTGTPRYGGWTTYIDNRRFRYAKRLNRAGPGIAGASFEQARIWNGNWEARWDVTTGAQTLSAVAEGIRLSLHLTPVKAPVIHGENGVSQKAEGAGKASYYVSFPRLAVEGVVNGVAVTGLAWMDHEWFTHQLEANQQGWDWFSVQLDTGAEFMLFQLRRTDGSIDAFSSGTYVAPDGRTTHLKHSDFALQPMEYWTSPKTSARYPVRWRISIPGLKVTLECAAAIPDQELVDDQAPTYWEGAVSYTGSATGAGYLEMTRYTKPMRL